ncbi:class I SAM-dependent methyltransferase [Exilibacterium tricleocarpae]|uniref:Class I SAM-dependent methyltransferase n=1 Tax=Exilibacterium tricleocarpae TaxID=2591008 RepID=A0A545TNP3_9GAMM|nr:class I SAM-dependent methyltransferase [Exilibacterium tricleocarpae]TQV78826.1 class I SAM-dependent methyltransferase [Exilibacterium tricleocarpae]
MSNGWEEIAGDFIAAREQSSIGVDVARAWAQTLPNGAAILDLGCGTGVPIALALSKDGFRIYGVDASPTIIAEFKRRLPQMSAACEPVETSPFFGRSFDGIVSIGLVFLLSADAQRRLIFRAAAALDPGGHFLFTSPSPVCEWTDLMTGRKSRSLGEETYIRLLSEAGLDLVGNAVDEGENYYFHAVKT